MAHRGYEIERRFPVREKVFSEVEKKLKKIQEYHDIIDTYYVFDLLRKKMVRARSVRVIFPHHRKGEKYQLCSKELFSPISKKPSIIPEMEMDEVEVNVDDFNRLTEIFDKIKDKEFTINGKRSYYKLPDYPGRFAELIITTDKIKNLSHKHWVEIEIFLNEHDAGSFNAAVDEICKIAKEHFGMREEVIRSPSKFPTYPEIYFWENWYNDKWCEGKHICEEFFYDKKTET